MHKESVRFEIVGDRSSMKSRALVAVAVGAVFVAISAGSDGIFLSIAFVVAGCSVIGTFWEIAFRRLTYLILHRERLDMRRDEWGLTNRWWMDLRKWKLPYSRIISMEVVGSTIRITYQSPVDGAETEPVATLEFTPRDLDGVLSALDERIHGVEPLRDEWALASV